MWTYFQHLEDPLIKTWIKPEKKISSFVKVIIQIAVTSCVYWVARGTFFMGPSCILCTAPMFLLGGCFHMAPHRPGKWTHLPIRSHLEFFFLYLPCFFPVLCFFGIWDLIALHFFLNRLFSPLCLPFSFKCLLHRHVGENSNFSLFSLLGNFLELMCWWWWHDDEMMRWWLACWGLE